MVRIVDTKTIVNESLFEAIKRVGAEHAVDVDWLGGGRRFIKLTGWHDAALDTVEAMILGQTRLPAIDVGDLEDDF